MQKFFKNLLLLSFLFFLLFGLGVVPAKAADQRCWTEKTCILEGTFFGPTDETTSACGMSVDASGEKIGFCLPGSQAVTQVEFAGRNTFLNFGEFLKWIYKYGVTVASGLAVVIIISAGLQWSISGGSPEKITAARKKIAGAMMGLFIAVASYFILNIINPYLVNLRLPQVWKINTIGLVPPYCDEVEGKKLSATKGGKFDIEPKAGLCGSNYYVEGGGENVTCKGSYCSGRGGCVPFNVDANNKKINQPFCSERYMNIHYVADGSARTFFSEKAGILQYAVAALESVVKYRLNEPDWLDNEKAATKLVVICDNAGTQYVDKFVELGYKAWYWNTIKSDENGELDYYEYLLKYDFASIQQAIKGTYSCKDGGNPIGMYIKNELDIELTGVADFNVYLSSLSNNKRYLTASRYGGIEGGAWVIPFEIFKNKNRFFRVDITGNIIKNTAKDPFSVPEIGKGFFYYYRFHTLDELVDIYGSLF